MICTGLKIHVCEVLNSLRLSDAYMCNLNTIGSDNGLWPGRHQAIIWTNAWMLLIGPVETHALKSYIKIHTFSLKKMFLKMSSVKWQPFCPWEDDLNKCECNFLFFSSCSSFIGVEIWVGTHRNEPVNHWTSNRLFAPHWHSSLFLDKCKDPLKQIRSK